MSSPISPVIPSRLISASSSFLCLAFFACWLCSSGTTIGATETILHNFAGAPSDGRQPYYARLVQGTDGNFYGVTYDGGSIGTGIPAGDGTFFKMMPNGTTTILYNFGSGFDGVNPVGLILGTDGNFYGTTSAGGINGLGTVFKIALSGSSATETVLYNFGATTGDGSDPLAGVIEGSDGNFYGTTSAGPSGSSGTIFKLTPLGVETSIHTFTFVSGAGNGNQPSAVLLQGSDGNLYGTTAQGGLNSQGIVFQITFGGVFTKIHDFGSVPSDGTLPEADLLQGSDGNLYGTTSSGGGSGFVGTIFKIFTDGTNYSVIHSFGNTDNCIPWAGLLQGPDGNLYGTTSTQNTTGTGGSVFEISSDGTTFTTLHSFTGTTDGAAPRTGLLRGTDGNLYGMTPGGGSSGNGIIFKLSPGTSSLISFSTWEMNYGIPTQLPTDTPLNDRTPNLLKYFCDINPTVAMTAADQAALPHVALPRVVTSSAPNLTLVYRQAAYVTGVTPNIQGTFDLVLQPWTTITPSPVTTIGADFQTGDLIQEAQVPVTDRLQFIRLQLVLTSP